MNNVEVIKIMNNVEVRRKLAMNWNDQEYRDKVLAMWKDPDFVKRFAEIARINSRKRWSDPAMRLKMTASIKKIWENEKLRKRTSEITKRCSPLQK